MTMSDKAAFCKLVTNSVWCKLWGLLHIVDAKVLYFSGLGEELVFLLNWKFLTQRLYAVFIVESEVQIQDALF